VLKKSKIESAEKSRESRFLATSATATPFKINGEVRHRFLQNDEVPHVPAPDTYQRPQ